VLFRVIRPSEPARKLPVLMVLGGHRTGSDAVDLFGHVGDRAVVALDYPYAGPEKVRGIRQILSTLPLARQAFRDTPPAVALVLDWIGEQAWADQGQLIIIGASLGVPFAALAAARDPRIDAVMLVHGAADNLAWLEAQVARRSELTFLHRPLATLIHWMAYGPTFDTAANVARISPRPVVIIGARDDERTPAGETEALFAAAGEPKVLRWTEGRHVEPDRSDVIAQLLAIADQELPQLSVDR
jgi:dienelactone hydrolase